MPDTRTLDYRDPEWLAEHLGVDKSTIYRYLQDGTLPGLQLGRKWLVSEQQVIDFLDREAKHQTETRRRDRESGQDHFDKFTERARRVIITAQEEALAFNHNYVGTEHMLLALVRQTDGLAAIVLVNLGMDLESVRPSVELMAGRGTAPAEGEIGLTPRAKKAVELAVDEARRLKHRYIGTEHLLIGLVRAGEGITAGIFSAFEIETDAVRAETMRLLAQTLPAVGPSPG